MVMNNASLCGMAMDEAEQPFWEDTSEMTPPQLEYISERKRAGEWIRALEAWAAWSPL